jgi:hypothetical protein
MCSKQFFCENFRPLFLSETLPRKINRTKSLPQSRARGAYNSKPLCLKEQYKSLLTNDGNNKDKRHNSSKIYLCLLILPDLALFHRVGRVLSFFSSRQNRDRESPNSDEGTYTVVLYIYM